ncbi:unnamed protein product [Hermetia illucens]|uniref:BPTI/Kunitz inhibitor domain-containing protein n=1 Tax=Hermetia illucens TaxID=343691 RepID=A0A7R8YPV3_HERIL|nr:PI-actitoxin-Axm2b-like [Hermetia illucens]CAD7079845.1 unnamed protein product [Hermetia illucens]
MKAVLLIFLICAGAFLNEAKNNEICWLPQQSGFCRMRQLSYFFDNSTQTCQSFVYGGCGGNRNRFHTEAECIETCV